ncbi:MAG: CdaR family transcriptional regulator [Frankiales bacterium]|nr:CdaR family transcriptional regulator [Frankiales bacterium]
MASEVPWKALPGGLADSVRPHLPGVVAEIIAAVAEEVPDYARPIEGAFGEGLRLGVEVALGRFLELPGTSSPALGPRDRRLYVDLGRGELRQGRELQTLLAAYRVGARVAFRRFADIAREAGFEADAVVPLAESVFAYIDELSATSVEGYAREQSTRAGEADRRRSELLTLLLSGLADGPALAAAAALAGWTIPEQVVAVVLEPGRGEGLATRLGQTALVGREAHALVAVLPAPGRASGRPRLAQRLAGRGAVVSPAKPVAELRTCLALARAAAALTETGVLTGDPVFVDEHLSTLLLHRDADLLGLIVAERLRPLDGLKPTTRARLEETLLSWLAHRGERQRVAAELHVHPQTVGYRLGQLRELFGDLLEQPHVRFELEIALRGSR